MIDTFVYSKVWISSIIVVYFEDLNWPALATWSGKKQQTAQIKPGRWDYPTNPMESIQDYHKSPQTKHEFSISQIQKINTRILIFKGIPF